MNLTSYDGTLAGRSRRDRRVAPLPWDTTSSTMKSIATALIFISAFLSEASPTASFDFISATSIGTFNMCGGQAEMERFHDGESGHDILKISYHLPAGGIAGIWAKEYPADFSGDGTGELEISTRSEDSAPAGAVSFGMELKGTTGTQAISLPVGAGWKTSRHVVRWDKIGKLSEAVILVSRNGKGEAASGKICLDASFVRLSFWEKLSVTSHGKIEAVAVLSLILSLIFLLPIGAFSRQHRVSGTFAQNIELGVAVVLVACISATTYIVGSLCPFDAIFVCLGIALAGAAAGGLLKFGLTGYFPRPGEIFRDSFISGLLAASSSLMQIWQAPSSWGELSLLSGCGASVFSTLYHLSNAYELAAFKRHIKKTGTIIIAGFPYLFGFLLALQTAGSFTPPTFSSLISDLPHSLEICNGLVCISLLFLFNELLANGLSILCRNGLISGIRAHLQLLFFAAFAVAASFIADLGSGTAAAGLCVPLKQIAAILSTMVSQGGLWAEVFMITGIIIDSSKSVPPSAGSLSGNALSGMKKGMAFSAILMGILQVVNLVTKMHSIHFLYHHAGLLLFGALGALAYPLIKTIVESFDGSQSFFERASAAYKEPVLYARGLVIGTAFSTGLTANFAELPTSERIMFGSFAGLCAFAGVSAARDFIYGLRQCGGLRVWRFYLVEGFLGAFIGAGLGFYLDAAQVPVVVDKFRLYNSFGLPPASDDFIPLLSKWGTVKLGTYAGGAKLIFNEALKGVIGWGVAAWLFALNKSLLAAIFQRNMNPVRRILSRDGVSELVDNTIHVLRWGLWMAPIIFTFLRKMPTPTWYNQDGAIHTVFAIVNDATMTPEEFTGWSLKVFMWILAYDFFRILIWLDHMGLRVATLVNLSFVGMDKLDDIFAKFIGKSAANARFIPEGIKRFTTWVPLLIPFYVPAGANWDWVWTRAEAIQKASPGGLAEAMSSLGASQAILLFAGASAGTTLIFYIGQRIRKHIESKHGKVFRINNRRLITRVRKRGEIVSILTSDGYDLTRRAYDKIDPAGCALFIAEDSVKDGISSWPVVGNFPRKLFSPSIVDQDDSGILVRNTCAETRTNIRISQPSKTEAVQLWDISVENLGSTRRKLKVVPYLEWVLNSAVVDRTHTQYNRLFMEVGYAAETNSVIAVHYSTKKVGILASEIPTEGFLGSRMDFIGRAGTIWNPRALQTLAFEKPYDTTLIPTFDPAGAILIGTELAPGQKASIRLLIGCADTIGKATELAHIFLKPQPGIAMPETQQPVRKPVIGHGEKPPEINSEYCKFSEDGLVMRIMTPFTPRPFDHTMTNAIGHITSVTNRGLHTSSSVNSQQNRITTDWADTVTSELPSETFHLYDFENKQWFSPTYLPLRDTEARHIVEFRLDGTAVFRMEKGTISTELTVFVPTLDPTGVYILKVTNRGDTARHLRFSPCFRIVLADNPENAITVISTKHESIDAVFFTNPNNIFRSGPAFAAVSLPAEIIETCRGGFIGNGRSISKPFMTENGAVSTENSIDDAKIAAFLCTLEIPPGESRTVTVLLGQANTRKEAESVIRKYKDPKIVQEELAATRKWWLGLMDTLRVRTNDDSFDRFLNWLKFQTLSDRIWARRGFYQSSGAYGFRDQLQDSVNMIWADPSLARIQILLHCGQQFIEGDVLHWFFCLQDGRTGFSSRSHASDNLLWLAWATVEYLRMTGDESILEEKVAYLKAETPLQPLPKDRHGMGMFPLRSTCDDSLYSHALRAVNLVLEKRMGSHGIPLMGTGDWNDGLDEIGSQGKGESVWLAFFLYYILDHMIGTIEKKNGSQRAEYYRGKLAKLKDSIEKMWREDRYLRAINDDGIEIGIKGSGVWEIDALTVSWAVISGLNHERGRIVFDAALEILESDKTILLGWPALRENTRPYLGRSCRYPEGVRENGMYCHGVQWLVKAARILAVQSMEKGDEQAAAKYRETAFRLWSKISPIPHTLGTEIELYGGQPNKQAADMLTKFDDGRMTWNGYTGAAGWMLRDALEAVVGAELVDNKVIMPSDIKEPRGSLVVKELSRESFPNLS